MPPHSLPSFLDLSCTTIHDTGLFQHSNQTTQTTYHLLPYLAVELLAPFLPLLTSTQVIAIPTSGIHFPFFDTPSLLHLGWFFIFLAGCHQALDCTTALHLPCAVSPCFLGCQSFFFTSIFVILHFCCRISFTYSSYINPWVVTPRVVRPRPQQTRLAMKGPR